VCHFSCNNLQSSTEIVLYETTNVIEVYVQNKPTCNSWNNGNALIGIQNATGTTGLTPPGRNTGPWSANNEAWRFVPSGPAIWGPIQWFSSSGLIANTNTVQVCPSSTTTYTAVTTYTRCDGFTISVSAPITITSNNSYTVSSNAPICAGQNLSLTVTGAPANATYTWTGPNGFTSNQQNPVINNATVNHSGTYSVNIGTGGNSCIVATNVSIIGHGSSTISPSSSVCPGSNVTFSISNNSTLTTNYTWTGPNGFTSNQQNPTINNVNTLNSGVYTVTVSVNSGTLNFFNIHNISLCSTNLYAQCYTQFNNLCRG
jgi:hypothetical protein